MSSEGEVRSFETSSMEGFAMKLAYGADITIRRRLHQRA